MTSLSRFKYCLHCWKVYLLLVVALLFSGCSAAASVGPNTARPLSTAIPSQAAVATAAVQPATAVAQPATLTPVPSVQPTQIPSAQPTQIATIVATAKPTAAPTIVSTQLPATAVPAATAAPAPASGTGTLLFLRNGNLWAVDDTGGNERQLAEGVVDFAPSANASTIALLRGQGRNTEIWLIGRDGTGLRQLTKNNRAEARLSWAADGSALVTGSAATDAPYAHEWPAWSRWCSVAEVYLVDSTTGAETSLAAGCDPAFAPDSKRIAYSAPPARVQEGFGADGPMVENTIRLINRQGQNGWNFAVANGDEPESGGLLVYSPSWSPDSSQVIYHRFLGSQVESDINLIEIGRSFEGQGKTIAEGAGWILPARFSASGERVILVENDYGNARGLVGYGAWSVEIIHMQGSREIALPNGPINAVGQMVDKLRGAQAAVWAPGGQALAVMLPQGWSANGDPEAWGEQPGEIRRWLPGQAPGAVLAKQVDYGSPIAWLAAR